MMVGDFSQRALAIQPTGVRKMFDLAGDDVISFGLGEPDVAFFQLILHPNTVKKMILAGSV